MKLLTYEGKDKEPRAGVLRGNEIVDLTELLGSQERLEDVAMLAARFPDTAAAVRDALAQDKPVSTVPLDSAVLLSPVLRPSAVRDSCMFDVHSKNAGKESNVMQPPLWYERPIFYYQNPNNIIGPGGTVRRKEGSTTLDYEAEVAFVIGKQGYNVGIEEADDYILGLTIFNDWSDRKLCAEEAGFLGMHKSKDFCSGLGPWVVTMDEFSDVMPDGKLDLKVRAWVNDVLTTDSGTSDMRYSLAELFRTVAEDLTVMPGDVVGIGTVGYGCLYEQIDRFPFLSDGDTVTIEVERIGKLVQHVAGK